MLEITIEQRKALRASAHALTPVVIISQNGLSESVMQEIERSLVAHELIKIRVVGDDRALREHYFASICDTLKAAPVQHIGKLLVIWRPQTEAQKNAAKANKRGKVPRYKRDFQGNTRKA